jgi:hypothetical protein
MFQWIGMVEYILCYGGPAEHWGPLPATRLASRKILIEQNIKEPTGPALCVLCGVYCKRVNSTRVYSERVYSKVVDTVLLSQVLAFYLLSIMVSK